MASESTRKPIIVMFSLLKIKSKSKKSFNTHKKKNVIRLAIIGLKKWYKIEKCFLGEAKS